MPAPERKRQTSWTTFLKAHRNVLGAIDFTTVEVRKTGGLVTHYVLFVMKVAARTVHLAGITTNPKTECLDRMNFFSDTMLQAYAA